MRLFAAAIIVCLMSGCAILHSGAKHAFGDGVYKMTERNLKPKDLVDILSVSKGLVSDILNYKKGLSKDIIRILATHFKVSQEAFNRSYKLIPSIVVGITLTFFQERSELLLLQKLLLTA